MWCSAPVNADRSFSSAHIRAASCPELALIANTLAHGASVWILYRLATQPGNGPLGGLLYGFRADAIAARI